jgi:biotin carboxyl carrier protein
MRLFISYSHKDKRFAGVLSQALRQFGIEVWLDEHQLEIGEYVSRRIFEAINEVDFVIVVVSPNSVASRWVAYELSLVLDRERTDNKVRLLPLLLQDAKLPDLILDRLIADFRTAEMMDKDFRRLLKRLGISKSSFRERQDRIAEFRRNRQTRIIEVRAPILGTFYRGPYAGEGSYQGGNPFVEAGDQVSPGAVLCIIVNRGNDSLTASAFEIESENKGRIESICVEDGDWVADDQLMFLIEA